MARLKRVFSARSYVIEAVAISLAAIIVIAGGWALYNLPVSDFKRENILRVIEVTVGALAVVALLLLWAQLRHTAVLNKLLSYHEYFHNLPEAMKVNDLYELLLEHKIAVPIWQKPLANGEVELLYAKTKDLGSKPARVIREYLNDFEEFSAAINCGLVDEDYAYQIEGTRLLNAYFGFRGLIIHWLADDRRKAEEAGEPGQADITNYRELRAVAERWRVRMRKEARRAENRRQQQIEGKL